MLGNRIRVLLTELASESMRLATFVGLLAILAGSLWVYLFETASFGVVILAGVVVGVLYNDRPTSALRAGSRTGLFAPIPEASVQTYPGIYDLWATSASVEMKVALAALAGILVFFAFWLIGAVMCTVSAAVTARIVARTRPFLPFVTDTGDR